jgi:4-alpha-glucanotransferase
VIFSVSLCLSVKSFDRIILLNIGDLMLTQRRSGILLHPTSLPGKQPIGSLGQEAYDFVDFLVAAGQSVWQILPLGPVGYGNCPYSSVSAFAGNPLLINLELLIESGDLEESERPVLSAATVADFDSAFKILIPALNRAARQFQQHGSPQRKKDFEIFCVEHSYWLDDYALFVTISEYLGCDNWYDWPVEIRHRQQNALNNVKRECKETIYRHKYCQFVFFEQWMLLKHYANERGIRILGDLPIFVAENSADIWANRNLFFLDEDDRPTLVAGVPPDYFSKTGQRWGNPLYRWEQLINDDFSWWVSRFRWNFELFDLLRVDHFRGFSSCWAIPAEEPTAVNGYWQETPGEELFTCLQQEFGSLPIIAEDLGIITPDVEQLRDQFNFPGMKILQFAFDSGPDNPYLPANHIENSVIYTGTHDNNTSLGWWNGLDEAGRQRVRNFLDNPCDNMPWPLIEVALSSIANMAIIPLQDFLSLGEEGRMNIPGKAIGNWQWRFPAQEITADLTQRIKSMSHLYGRNLCITTEI